MIPQHFTSMLVMDVRDADDILSERSAALAGSLGEYLEFSVEGLQRGYDQNEFEIVYENGEFTGAFGLTSADASHLEWDHEFNGSTIMFTGMTPTLGLIAKLQRYSTIRKITLYLHVSLCYYTIYRLGATATAKYKHVKSMNVLVSTSINTEGKKSQAAISNGIPIVPYNSFLELMEIAIQERCRIE